MKGILQRFRRPVGPGSETITVCWSDTGVTFLRWLVPPSGNPVCMNSASLPAEACGPSDYSGTLRRLYPALRSRRPRMVWFVMGEPAMALQHRGDCSTGIPQWMECCWAGIGPGELPEGIIDGMDCLEQQLVEWDRFACDGHAFFITLHRRACLFAYAEGKVFRRVSRLIDSPTTESLLHEEEWMQQTRMLYRNRTGLELREVYPAPSDEGGRS